MKWKKYKLKDLVDNFSIRARDYGGSEGLEFLGVSNDDGIVKSKSAAEHKGEEYKIIEKGCFAYNPYRVNIGSIAYHNDDVNGLISPAYVIFKTKPNTIKDNLLFKFLKSGEGLRQIRFHGRGTVRQALRFEDLCKIEISIPSFEEQEFVIKNLENIKIETDEVSAELTHQLDLVKQLRQSFLCEAMQGKLLAKAENANITIPPAKAGDYLLDNNTTFSDNEINWNGFQPIPNDSNPIGFSQTGQQLLEKIKAEKTQLIAEKKIKKEKPLAPISQEEIPFEIPDHWAWCRLGEICETRLGKMLDKVKNKGNFQPYLRNLNVQWNEFSLEDVLLMKFEDKELEEYSVKKGDLLICEGGYPGRAAIWNLEDETYKFQKALHRVRFYLNTQVKFYLFYLNFICTSEKIKDYFTGSGIQHLTGKSLKEMPIPLPPLHEQEQIIAKLEELMRFCDGLEQSIKESQGYNDMLLQQVLREALKGEEI